MSNNYLQNLIKFFTLLVLFLLISIYTFSLFYGYTGSINHIVHAINQEKYSFKIYNIVTLSKFHYLQAFIIVLIVFIGVLIYYFKPIYKLIKRYVIDFYLSIKLSIQKVLKSEIKYLLILPVFSSFYFAIILPVSNDEAWTYINFTAKSLLSPILYYPDPNNHVLHSLITVFTKHFPFLSPLMCLRISSIFVNVFIWIFTYSFLTKYFNKNTALIIVSIASMLFLNIYYSYMSRGYALVNLFFIIAFYSSFNIIKQNNQTKHWVWFGISSILGFYTMPSFLYPFITLNLFILLFNYKFILKQLLINVFILFSVIILYLPIIIVNGLGAITNNKWVAPIPRIETLKRLPNFLLNAISDLTGFSWIFIIALLTLSFILLLIKREKEKILIYILFIISPIILLTIHSVIPFSRTFIYYGFIIAFIIILPLNSWVQNIKRQYLLFSLVLIQSALLYNFYNKIFAYSDCDITSDKVVKKIEGNKKYLCNDRLFDVPLIFNIKTKDYDNAEVKYYYMVKMSADSIKYYDYVIIGKAVDETKKKTPKIQTIYFNVY